MSSQLFEEYLKGRMLSCKIGLAGDQFYLRFKQNTEHELTARPASTFPQQPRTIVRLSSNFLSALPGLYRINQKNRLMMVSSQQESLPSRTQPQAQDGPARWESTIERNREKYEHEWEEAKAVIRLQNESWQSPVSGRAEEEDSIVRTAGKEERINQALMTIYIQKRALKAMRENHHSQL